LLVPVLIGASDMIFPRLNALSLWLLMGSFVLLLLAMVVDGGVNAGWTFYVPLSIFNNSSIDLMLFSLHIAGLSSLLGSINFIVTILKVAYFSVTYEWLNLPLFAWSILITSVLLIISLPVLAGCITMIIFDRHFNTAFLTL
jgi:heme/copper-type cytochrome/quinol oxidase subunit 1